MTRRGARGRLGDLPVRHKLMLISMLATAVALLVTGVVLLSYEYRVFRQNLASDLLATAQVIGENSAAALAFDYPTSAEQLLKSLEAKPYIVGAAIYDADGRVFGAYGAGQSGFAPPPAEPDGARFGADALDLFSSITLKGEKVGTVFIRAGLDEMRGRVLRYGLVLLLVMLGASAAAFVLTTRLQRIVVNPVAHLAGVVGAVAQGKNYSVRAQPHGADELGRLIDGFNHMLDQIQAHETELRRKNLDLERALQAKDMFLANMSHELRTPLNAIIGFTGTLLMKLPGTLNPVQEEQLGIVQTSARHLLSLINDLLDLAKIESGATPMQMEPVECRAVLQEITAMLRPLAARKGVGFLLEAPGEIRLTTDLRALKQIVLNLCNNAIKFTDRGSVTLGLAPAPGGPPGAAEISVHDTGIGIRPEFQDKLFQAFAQMDSTHREGTGLGLHLSGKLAQLIGARIEFSSREGAGSRFWVTLPPPATG